MPGKGTLFAAKFGNSRVSSTDKSLAYSMFFMNWAWFTSHALWRFSPNSTQTLFCTPRTQSTRIASTKLARMHAHIRAIHWCTLCFVASKHQNYPFAPLIDNSTIFHHSFSPSSSTMSEDDCLTIWNSLSTLFRSSAISLSLSFRCSFVSIYDRWLSLYPTSELWDDPWQSSLDLEAVKQSAHAQCDISAIVPIRAPYKEKCWLDMLIVYKWQHLGVISYPWVPSLPYHSIH